MCKAAAAFLLCSLAVPAAAQNTDIEALAGLQFNFSNPGARALGMGGAFLALADDASAAIANPAGLTILRKTEVSIEGRDTTISQMFVRAGTYPNIINTDEPARERSVSFASVVLPLGDFAFAGYYHRPLDFHNRADVLDPYTTANFYLGPDGAVSRDVCATTAGCSEYKIYPYATQVDLELQTYGAALAWKRAKWSFGAALRYELFSEEAFSYRTDIDAPGTPTFVVAQMNGGRAYGDKSDSDMTYSLGAKWTASEKLAFGAVYKAGSSFPAPLYGAPDTAAPLERVGTTRFHLPDVIGGGVSYRPAPSLTINMDLVRIGYSHLTDQFVSVIEYSGHSGDVESVQGYRSKDGTEIRAGVEYFLTTRIPFALRAGWWRDPAHAIEFEGSCGCGSYSTPHDIAAAILFPGSRDENHYTLGVGLAWPRFQVDAAFDQSETLKVGSLSMVARF